MISCQHIDSQGRRDECTMPCKSGPYILHLVPLDCEKPETLVRSSCWPGAHIYCHRDTVITINRTFPGKLALDLLRQRQNKKKQKRSCLDGSAVKPRCASCSAEACVTVLAQRSRSHPVTPREPRTRWGGRNEAMRRWGNAPSVLLLAAWSAVRLLQPGNEAGWAVKCCLCVCRTSGWCTHERDGSQAGEGNEEEPSTVVITFPTTSTGGTCCSTCCRGSLRRAPRSGSRGSIWRKKKRKECELKWQNYISKTSSYFFHFFQSLILNWLSNQDLFQGLTLKKYIKLKQ